MRCCITMGDPSGVVPELILKAFREGGLAGEFVVVGDLDILRACCDALRYGVPLKTMGDRGDVKPGCVNVLDLGILPAGAVQIGRVSRASGCAARRYVETATRMALEGGPSTPWSRFP
jgi:4-hydroxythreonine-4-phosphate dehydrogenase